MTNLQNLLFKHAVQLRLVLRDQGGATTIQFALIAAAIAVFAALAIPPTLEQNLDQFAINGNSIDRRTTGSISNNRRHVIRKSILDAGN